MRQHLPFSDPRAPPISIWKRSRMIWMTFMPSTPSGMHTVVRLGARTDTSTYGLSPILSNSDQKYSALLRWRAWQFSSPSSATRVRASRMAYTIEIGAVWWYTRGAPSLLSKYLRIIDMSRYQFLTLLLRASSFASARGPRLSGATPGGHPMHFWVPAYAASTPQASKCTGRPQMEVTVSSSRRQSCLWQSSPMPFIGCRVPVLVSAWHSHITCGLCCCKACSMSSFVNTSPYGFVTSQMLSVYRPCRSSARSPKYPLLQIRCLSPGSVRLATAASHAADPVPDTGTVKLFSVCQTYRSRALTSSIVFRKSGSMWPTCGRLMMECTRGCAF
mmetsp:Transcript_4579/g.8473  ORF Transcript_4579/g.8473 Transcript_4579/m.8473 type:complete len:331 (-) Transcript_4579:185-1177(-)